MSRGWSLISMIPGRPDRQSARRWTCSRTASPILLGRRTVPRSTKHWAVPTSSCATRRLNLLVWQARSPRFTKCIPISSSGPHRPLASAAPMPRFRHRRSTRRRSARCPGRSASRDGHRCRCRPVSWNINPARCWPPDVWWRCTPATRGRAVSWSTSRWPMCWRATWRAGAGTSCITDLPGSATAAGRPVLVAPTPLSSCPARMGWYASAGGRAMSGTASSRPWEARIGPPSRAIRSSAPWAAIIPKRSTPRSCHGSPNIRWPSWRRSRWRTG